MSSHEFLFTYSVSVADCRNLKKTFEAERVRQAISHIKYPHWVKLKTVETTFGGLIELSSQDKRAEATELIRKTLRKASDRHAEYSDVDIRVALMVNELGACIKFKV